MCLATAYAKKEDTETVVAEYIAKVQVADGKVILTDILGEQIEIEGTLQDVDLSRSIVSIQVPA